MVVGGDEWRLAERLPGLSSIAKSLDPKQFLRCWIARAFAKISSSAGNCDASDSTCSNISEGFAQQSDRRFVQYLYYAKGSANEARTRLTIAHQRRYITVEKFAEADAIFDVVGKMTTRLIQYLERSNRPRRGLGPGFGGSEPL
jgi:four helix bundle protein